MNVVTLTTCKRSLAILGQHNTKKKVGASTKSKNCCHGCPKTWTVPYVAAQNSYQMIGRIKNMYKSEQYFVSMPKKHIFLQKGSSTLDDISLQNVIAHPGEFFFLNVQ